MTSGKYNPIIHHRRSIRLTGYDYSQAGAYFITICCHDKKCRFGTVGAPLAGAQDAPSDPDVQVTQMHLNQFGLIAYNEWIKLPRRFSNVELDVFQIMPNHLHGIIVLNVGATLAVAQNAIDHDLTTGQGQAQPLRHSVSDIIGAYKSLVANACLDIFKLKNETMGKMWQRNYYEHIIRDEQSYEIISEYIVNNPSKWNDDRYFEP